MLGRGGMAEVRKGTDTRLGRVVAVKRLRTDLASDATFQARFRREAQSSASLNHPAIVAVYDTGEEDGDRRPARRVVAQPYIVMEYVAGRTLRDILREGRKILPERALEITSGVLSALDYSHRAGIIHRDIKPGNVMLTPSGDVKVMDFGIARAISDACSTMTQTAAVVGTAQYLSPEQARGETVDSRSDVYSAGCLLYELLTGRPPFVGDSPVAVAYQHVREQAQPPSDHDQELPEAIDAIVMKSLAKRVEDRYQSAAAMRSDIERYLAGRPVHATPPAAPVEEPTTMAAPVAAAAGRATRDEDDDDQRSRTGLIVLLVLLLIGLIAAAAYLLPQLFESPPEQQAGARRDRRDREGGPGPDRRRRARGGRGDLPDRPRRPAQHGARAGPQPRPVRRARLRGRPRGVQRPAAAWTSPTSSASPGTEARASAGGRGLRGGRDRARVRRATRPGARDRPARPGASVPEGSTVTIFYSDGPEEVPDVTGLQAGARRAGAQRRRVRAARGGDHRHHRAAGHRGRAEPAGRPGGRRGLDGHHRGLGLRGGAQRVPSESPTEARDRVADRDHLAGLPTDTASSWARRRAAERAGGSSPAARRTAGR